MTAVEVLRAARERISDPERWCKGVEAMTADGRWADPISLDAVRWCAIGALGAAYDHPDDMWRAMDALTEVRPSAWGCTSMFNDDEATTHADVLRLFDKAIAKAEAA